MGEFIKKEDKLKDDHIIFFDKNMKPKHVIMAEDFESIYICASDEEYVAKYVNPFF